MDEKVLKDIVARLDKLEKYVFGEKTFKPSDSPKINKNQFTGPTGGIKFLITESFFREKRDFTSIRKELEKNSYYYSRQAVNEALKGLSKSSGPLVILKEGVKKLYVERR
jgi:hypothetical protein